MSPPEPSSGSSALVHVFTFLPSSNERVIPGSKSHKRFIGRDESRGGCLIFLFYFLGGGALQDGASQGEDLWVFLSGVDGVFLVGWGLGTPLPQGWE